jgi:hypothetical protein
VIGVLLSTLWYQWGFTAAVIGSVATLSLIWSLMRLAAAGFALNLDDAMSETPVLGDIYNSWFHPNTYFRQDTTKMYQEAVNRAFSKALEEMTSHKGIAGLGQRMGRPVLEDFHKK